VEEDEGGVPGEWKGGNKVTILKLVVKGDSGEQKSWKGRSGAPLRATAGKKKIDRSRRKDKPS